MNWPDDADGDVLRHLQRIGFDFSARAIVNFDVDIDDPRSCQRLFQAIVVAFPTAGLSVGEESILVQIEERLTYQFVVSTQERLSKIAAPFGGVCESWGVMFDPAEEG
jgi:hypothetical protein